MNDPKRTDASLSSITEIAEYVPDPNRTMRYDAPRVIGGYSVKVMDDGTILFSVNGGFFKGTPHEVLAMLEKATELIRARVPA